MIRGLARRRLSNTFGSLKERAIPILRMANPTLPGLHAWVSVHQQWRLTLYYLCQICVEYIHTIAALYGGVVCHLNLHMHMYTRKGRVRTSEGGPVCVWWGGGGGGTTFQLHKASASSYLVP